NATDILLNEQGQELSRKPGGPLHFIEQALQQETVPFQSYSGVPMEVEVMVTSHGEFGKVTHEPPPRRLAEVAALEWALVSTLLREWDILGATLPAKLCVDIQGYVRDGQDFGTKKTWDDVGEVAGDIFCLKGTEEELACLPPAVYEAQKQR